MADAALELNPLPDNLNVVPIRPGFAIPASSDRPVARGVRLVCGDGIDPANVFTAAWLDANIARAVRDLIEAQWLREYRSHDNGGSMKEEREVAFANMQSAVFGLAFTPAMNKRQLDQKKKAIGSAWLRAEGRLYDGLRSAVAADEARLTRRAQS
ncbi:hypothetical protein OVY48_18330 [Sphingobium sp. SA2]|uniref:hypothetical protein n=1 Tax=Sphingobium sp. SA2 TaxID=1524832 RepID=UPI0028C2578D|nr:hypothetical protein [Sphingobium sp. SA2]MDT7535370.1 hypothetical protein [Sphingobium sp. SA2]